MGGRKAICRLTLGLRNCEGEVRKKIRRVEYKTVRKSVLPYVTVNDFRCSLKML